MNTPKTCGECDYLSLYEPELSCGSHGNVGKCTLFPGSQARTEKETACGIIAILAQILGDKLCR